MRPFYSTTETRIKIPLFPGGFHLATPASIAQVFAGSDKHEKIADLPRALFRDPLDDRALFIPQNWM
jgi:hypothetical protein